MFKERKERKREKERRKKKKVLKIKVIFLCLKLVEVSIGLLSLILCQEHANAGLNMINDGFIKGIHVYKHDFKLGFAS